MSNPEGRPTTPNESSPLNVPTNHIDDDNDDDYKTIPITTTSTHHPLQSINQHQQQQQQQHHLETSRIYLVPPQPHSSITHFILTHSHSTPDHLLSSVALNEIDLSVDPVGLDLNLIHPSPPSTAHRFRKTRLLLLDIFKATILCLQTISTANRFVGPKSLDHHHHHHHHHHHQLSGSYSWSDRVLFPIDHPSQYTIHLLTLVCVPGLHFILGSSAVLAIHTRRCLGWRSPSIFFRSLKLGTSLLILNQLLMSPNILQTRGNVILTTLPIWSLGWNLIFITTILIGLFLIERMALNYLHGKTNDCRLDGRRHPGVGADGQGEEEGEEGAEQEGRMEWMETWADRIRRSIDSLLVLGACLIPFSIGYMLPGNRNHPEEDPDPDWWIEWSQTRPWWFWFFFVPTPKMSTYPRFKMVTNFAPIGWLPFVLLGAYYARRLLHKPQGRLGMFITHLRFCLISGSIFFLITRVLDVGNLAVPYERVVPGSDQIQPVRPGLMRWLRGAAGGTFWEMILYTTSYPPDLGHLSLASTLIFFLLAILDSLPVSLLSLSPLVQFGRSPIFFYSIQLLSFHYLLPSILVILDWPRHLNLIWVSIVSISCLPVLWLTTEAWVIFKDRQAPESIWRFF